MFHYDVFCCLVSVYAWQTMQVCQTVLLAIMSCCVSTCLLLSCREAKEVQFLMCAILNTSNVVAGIFIICDPTAWNESHWYSVTIQNATIFDLQVKNIDFRFSSKSGASGIFLFENITFNGQMWCFMTVSGILNCNCCNTVVCKTNVLNPISQNGTLYGSQIDLSITFEPVGRFAWFWYHLKGQWMLFTIV